MDALRRAAGRPVDQYVGEAEAQYVAIESLGLLEPRGGQDRMPHAERTGDEAAHALRRQEPAEAAAEAPDELQPVARRVVEARQRLHFARGVLGRWGEVKRDVVFSQPAEDRVELGGAGNLPPGGRDSDRPGRA